MSKLQRREELRDYLLWLLKGLELWRSWKIEMMSREFGRVTAEDLSHIVAPGEFFLDNFDQSRGPGKAIVSMVEQWYAHAADEVTIVLGKGSEAEVRECRGFLHAFDLAFGRDFFSMSESHARQIERILKAGRIRNDQDHEVVREVLVTNDSFLVSERDRARLEGISKAYEGMHKAG